MLKSRIPANLAWQTAAATLRRVAGFGFFRTFVPGHAFADDRARPPGDRFRRFGDFLVKLVNSFGKPIAPAAVARQEIGRRLPEFSQIQGRGAPQPPILGEAARDIRSIDAEAGAG